MKSTQLHFVRTVSAGKVNIPALLDGIPMYVLNRTEWRGKEARSCAVTSVKMPSAPINAAKVMQIVVTYQPKGFISYSGNTKYDGWTMMGLDRKNDGTLLDGKGQPLKDGEPLVYLPYEVYKDTDFNELELGEFVKEIEVGGMPRTTVEAIMAEFETSDHGSMTMFGSFTAPRRTRPLRKIVLSNRPSGKTVDDFNSHITNINLSIPHLEQVLMDELTKLMCDFLEGKASIKTIETDDFAFVQLSSALIDCSPNEHGLETWFDMMHAYTPIDFLERLAKQLQSSYKVQVEVIEGKKGGLVLRHEKKK